MTCWFHHCLSSGISCLKNSSVIPSLYLCSTHAVTSYLRHCHWRRLYRAQCTCPPPLLQMAGYGGIVCRRTTNKKLTTLTDITKKLTKTINCTKSGGAWQKKISDASGRTCATTFKLVSASFDTVIALFFLFLRQHVVPLQVQYSGTKHYRDAAGVVLSLTDAEGEVPVSKGSQSVVVSNLVPKTPYVFHIRARFVDGTWGPRATRRSETLADGKLSIRFVHFLRTSWDVHFTAF